MIKSLFGCLVPQTGSFVKKPRTFFNWSHILDSDCMCGLCVAIAGVWGGLSNPIASKILLKLDGSKLRQPSRQAPRTWHYQILRFWQNLNRLPKVIELDLNCLCRDHLHKHSKISPSAVQQPRQFRETKLLFLESHVSLLFTWHRNLELNPPLWTHLATCKREAKKFRGSSQPFRFTKNKAHLCVCVLLHQAHLQQLINSSFLNFVKSFHFKNEFWRRLTVLYITKTKPFKKNQRIEFADSRQHDIRASIWWSGSSP